MKTNISQLITCSQSGDKNSTLALVNMFDPLLKKYAGKLRYEDAYPDLLLAFLTAMNKIDLRSLASNENALLIAYIHQVVKNEYISLGKKKRQRENSVLLIEDVEKIIHLTPLENIQCEDFYFGLVFEEIRKYLTDLEFDVLLGLYAHGLSVHSIAQQKGVSRQAINTTKNRALRKLRKEYYGLV